MRAFVLSGGGNFGPLQVGALRALLERGIMPKMVVGCSAGALNAAFLAQEVSLARVERLADLWRMVTQADVYPGSYWGALWRLLLGRDSLYDNRALYAFLQRNGVTPATEFAHLRGARLFVTATSLRTGQLHVFGDDPHDRVLDALMASTALAPMHPPWEVNGERYVDGGTVTPLPLRVALARGATEIYALDLIGTAPAREAMTLRGIPALLRHSIMTTVRLQAQYDVALARQHRQVRLHYIGLGMENPPPPTDFDREEEMFEAGYAQTVAQLEHTGKTVETKEGWSAWLSRFRPRLAVQAPAPAVAQFSPPYKEPRQS
ncbi:MAG TPA: patatin-like phospholipase family protein [Caldilineaceae bacterium]|nr:patatin-like phospholipase family protein [Caldilineaceae bacterium]